MIAAIRSIVTYLTVSLYVLVIGPPILLLAIVFQQPGLLYAAGQIGVRLGLFLSGIRYTISGAEYIRRQPASVYAVNHASNVEPPVLFLALRGLFPRLRILYKAELRKLPILTRAFEESLVPGEADARSGQVPGHLRDLRSGPREECADRGKSRPRPRTLLHDEEPVDRPCKGREGGSDADDSRDGSPDGGPGVLAAAPEKLLSRHKPEPIGSGLFFETRR